MIASTSRTKCSLIPIAAAAAVPRTAQHRTDGRAGERSGHHQARDEARCGAAEDAGDGGERLSIDG